MYLFPLQLFQKGGYARIIGGEHDVLHDVAYRLFPLQICVVKIPLVNEPDYVVDLLPIDGQAE